MIREFWIIFGSFSLFLNCLCEKVIVDPSKCNLYGPGLNPDKIVLPARYFFIETFDKHGKRIDKRLPQKFKFQIIGSGPYGSCRYEENQIDRGDGSVIVRYKIIEWCDDIQINVKYNGSDVGGSPYHIRGRVHSSKCYCPQDLSTWLYNNKCPEQIEKITWDLQAFKKVNFTAIRSNLIKRYSANPGGVSFCNYVVKNQEIYRQCYGKYTGFKMFMDSALLTLGKLVMLPDVEFFVNLGDWPLSKKGGQQRFSGPFPIFSWCGSGDSHDITLPTYDIMESTLENMGRVSLDMLSVQEEKYAWKNKENKAFWRGRDARQERLDLIKLSRKYPNLINASLTNFFFFKDEEENLGPKEAHIPFTEFFKFKYQINIDGTVAAYRFPFLLAGNSVVLKQESPFYEHFYNDLKPLKHYIPVKRDLSDLIDKIQWAKEHEKKVKEIIQNAREYVNENLLPTNIFCYHVLMFKEWSSRLISEIKFDKGMEHVEQDFTCKCERHHHFRDEL